MYVFVFNDTATTEIYTLSLHDALPISVVVDSRSLRSAPSAWARGFDGGKLVKGIKLLVVCDKHGSLLDLELHPANTDDRAGILPTLPRLAALGFEGDRSEEHTSELQSRQYLVCRLLLEKKKTSRRAHIPS